jgi:energy-converting hydrogenase Eha subunit A
MGVALMLGLLAFSFGLVLQKIFDKVSLFDGVLIALTTAFLVASVMGRAFINGARIAVPARIVHALVAIMFFYCAVELYRRPIVEYALARTKTSIETYESVKNFERSAEWLTTVKDELKEGAGKIKSAVKP